MVRVMGAAPAELMFRLLPGMIARQSGLVVNVASVAGLADTGAGAVYGAAKSFLVSLSTSVAREVASYGVRVAVVCPGPTRTGFHERPDMRVTVAGTPGWLWMGPRAVARRGLRAALAGQPVIIPGAANRMTVRALRLVPRPVIARAAKLVLGAYRRLAVGRIRSSGR
jgi:hypothetical protein